MKPLIIAHRGYSAQAPENTMSAFRLGWEAGADGIECDVHLTADHEIVCIHDYETSRVSDESLRIEESDWEALRKLDVGSWKGSKWEGERIPTLRQLLEEFPKQRILVVEVKCGPEITKPLSELLGSFPELGDRLVIISFNDAALAKVKRSMPNLKAYWLSNLERLEDGTFTPSVEEIMHRLDSLGVDGFGGQSGQGISENLVKALGERGYELNVWTVDDPTEAQRMKSIGVTSITTNDPRLIKESLIQEPDI